MAASAGRPPHRSSKEDSVLRPFLTEGAAGLPALQARLLSAGGVLCDFGRESLTAVLQWLVNVVEYVPKAEDPALPDWIRTSSSYRDNLFVLVPESAVLVKIVGYYMGECFVREGKGAIRWAVGTLDHIRRDKPVVTGFLDGEELAVQDATDTVVAQIRLNHMRPYRIRSFVERYWQTIPRG